MKKIIAVFVVLLCMLTSFAMDLEKTYGLFKVELNEKTGTFSISVLDTEREKYIPVISRTDSSSNTKLYVLSGSTVYPLNLRYGVSVATEISDLYTRMEYTVAKKFSVNLYFSFYASENDGVFDIMQVDAVLKNISDSVKNYSFKIVFDTILGESTKSHFSTAEKMAVVSELNFPSMTHDKWIRSSDGTHAVQFLLSGSDIIEPWKAVLANRDVLLTSTWNPAYKDGRGFNSFYSFNDSALLIQNDGMLIQPDEEHDMRFYITTASLNKNPPDENCTFLKAKKYTEDGSLKPFENFIPPLLKENEFPEVNADSDNPEKLENAEGSDKDLAAASLVRAGEENKEKPINSKKAKKEAEKEAKKKAKEEAKKAKQKEREERWSKYADDESEEIEKSAEKPESENSEKIDESAPEEKVSKNENFATSSEKKAKEDKKARAEAEAKEKEEAEQRKQEEKESKKKAKEEKEAKKKADAEAKANAKALDKAKDKAAKKAEAEEKAKQKALEKAKAKAEKKEKAAQKKLAKAEKDKAAKDKAAKDKAAKALAKKQEEDAKKSMQPVKVEQKKKSADDDVELAGPTVLYAEQEVLAPEERDVKESLPSAETKVEKETEEKLPFEEEVFEDVQPAVEEVDVQTEEPSLDDLELIEDPEEVKKDAPREMTDEEYLQDLMRRLDEMENNPEQVDKSQFEKLSREIDLFLQYSNIKLDGAGL